MEHIETPSIEMPDKLKNRLYPVVLELFSKNDFHQVTIRDISTMSGLSTSTIYKYFTSKEDLLFTIIDEKVAEIHDLVRLHLQGLESSREMFRKAYWVLMDYYDRNPGVAITFFITVPTRTWMQKDSYRQSGTYAILIDTVLQQVRREELDPRLKGSQILGLFFMHCYHEVHRWYFNKMTWKLVDAIPDFFPAFWKAVSAPSLSPSQNNPPIWGMNSA
ncbi:MAG TPA: TetR/AcrR family transcriptional regulator [Deltaproteobacteria bacterium]|nr:TetR/AcrR family transcriptional regulator [Deltaproteobacteria bacterium]